MPRRMADSVTPSNLPPGFDVYGCYDDGSYNNQAEVQAMYPGKPLVVFTVFAQDLRGGFLDVESGDATPEEAPGWVASMRALGHPAPGVYCSEALWSTVINAFGNQGVAPLPPFIIAAYPGPGPVMIPGAIGHQWIDRGPYDESVVADYIPGVDPPPTPQGVEMPVSAPIEFKNIQHVFQTSFGVLWWKRFEGGKWVNEILCGPSGTTASTVNDVIPNQPINPVVLNGQLLVTVENSTTNVLYFALSAGQPTPTSWTWGVNLLP